MYQTPSRVLPRNGYTPAIARPTGLGQINPMDPIGRQNLAKVSTAVAMGGAAAWALLAMPSASKKNKLALGAIGGGLAATALLNLIDIL